MRADEHDIAEFPDDAEDAAVGGFVSVSLCRQSRSRPLTLVTRFSRSQSARGGRYSRAAWSGCVVIEVEGLRRSRVHPREDHAASFSRICRLARPSSAVMPRMRSGLTASVSPRSCG